MRRLTVLVLVLLLAAAPAQAQEISATVSPEAVVHGRDQQVTWRIRVRAGGERVVVPLQLTMRRSTGFLPAWIEPDGLRLEGPGQMQPARVLISEPCEIFREVLPTFGLRRGHGTLTSSVGVDLDLPANADSTLVVPAGIVADAPWPGMTYRLQVERLGTEPAEVAVPEATIGGQTGVPVSIDTEPASTDQICQDASPAHPFGRAIRITGQADPGIAGDRVDILAGGPGDRGPRVLGAATVAPDGTFAFDGWQPAEPGQYAVGARYVSRRPERADDFAEPRMLTIAPPPPPPITPEPPANAVATAGTPHISRTGRVSLRLACPGEAITSCRGVVRLFRGRNRIARSYELAPRSAARVSLRLRARDRRTFRRRGRITVALQHAPWGATAVTDRVTLRRR